MYNKPDGPRRTDRPRKIRDFDRTTLLRLGSLAELPAGLYAEILERVPLQQVMRAPSGATALQADLRALLREKGLTATERDALVSGWSRGFRRGPVVTVFAIAHVMLVEAPDELRQELTVVRVVEVDAGVKRAPVQLGGGRVVQGADLCGEGPISSVGECGFPKSPRPIRA